MVLIKLVMCAFGSYAEENVIDFSHKQEGVFLITGDTGSGKTTIFDAITFALYGKTSGDRREGAMMRSQYAKKDQPSYVEFTFRIKRDVYVIRRNPAYQIETHYKNGKVKMVNKDEAVTLIENGQEFVTTRKTEVNKRILEIIKVDFDQFTQIAMIAQGEFMKLLTAETKKKKEIFSKLFHTGIYQDIARELEQKCVGYYKDLKDEELLCRHQLDQVVTDQEEWQEIKALPLARGEEMLTFLAQQIQTDECLWQEEKEQLEQLLEMQRKNQEEITAGENLLKLYDTKEQLLFQARKYNEEVKLLPQMVDDLTDLEQNLQPKYHKAVEALAVFEQLEQVGLALNRHQSKLKECVDKIKENEALLSKVQQQYAALEAQVVDAGEAEKSLIRLEHDEGRLQDDLKRGNDLKKLYHKYQLEKSAYQDAMSKTELERTTRNQIQIQFQNAEDQYFLAQAGILAEHLVEGMPCPVCGSCEHPQKTALSEGAPDKAQLDQLKQTLRVQEEKLQRQMQTEGAAKEKVLLLKGQLRDEYKKIYGEQLFTDEYESACQGRLFINEQKETELSEAYLNQFIFSIQESIRINGESIRQVKEQIKRVELIKARMITLLNNCEEIKEQTEQLGVLKEKHQIGAAQSQETFQRLKEQTMGASKAEVQVVCGELKEQIQQTQEKKTKIRELLAKLQLVTQQIADRDLPDLTKAYQWREESKAERAEREQLVQTLMLKVTGNRQCYEFLEAHFVKIQDVAEKYQTYLVLHETANGRVSGKIKIDFETYVQRQYLKKILHAANKRLYEMSMGQFILKMKDLTDAGKVGNEGLDLYIHSLVTNSDRDVKTLSGGESFIAALSMALGLSDVVTRTVGSIHLHLMFIDEGFGSLDDASRSQAIKILNSLAGTKTLVGIISHVSELKEQIDEKLVVSKSDRGSTVRWEKF